jgi:hypothetical protein
VSGTSETPKKGRPPAAWRDAFLKALADTGNVRAACHVAGVGRTTAYRAQADDPAFAAAWETAIEESVDLLEIEARRRAVKGTDKPVFHQGKQVASVKEYSDTLLIFLLKANRPEKYRDNYKLNELLDQITRHVAGQPPAPGAPGPGKHGGTGGGAG